MEASEEQMDLNSELLQERGSVVNKRYSTRVHLVFRKVGAIEFYIIPLLLFVFIKINEFLYRNGYMLFIFIFNYSFLIL